HPQTPSMFEALIEWYGRRKKRRSQTCKKNVKTSLSLLQTDPHWRRGDPGRCGPLRSTDIGRRAAARPIRDESWIPDPVPALRLRSGLSTWSELPCRMIGNRTAG